MTKTNSRAHWLMAVSALALGIAGSLGLAGPANAITTQDDIDPNALVDNANQYANVGGLLILNPDIPPGFTGICTGTLVNPRTVLTATHCIQNSAGTEVYSTVVGTPSIRFRLAPNGLAVASNFVTDVIAPPGAGTVDLFPDQDFTILALSQPVGGVDYAPILLSPLTHSTLATIVGYGTFGTGSDPSQGLDFRRRVAANVIDYLGTFDDYLEDTGFGPGAGGSSQMLYWSDFDYVGRTGFFTDSFGLDYDTFPGDAVFDPGNPQNTEGNTGGGDSGGPLFAHVNGQQYLAGVLSGGLTIWVDGDDNPLFGFYGAPTYWNPIFAYSDFLIANNPYKYVHSRGGNGDWTDPRHWEQTLDPGYFVFDNHGNPVNGTPRTTPDDEAIKFGRARDIFDIFGGGDGLPSSVQTSNGNVSIAGIQAENNFGGGSSGGSRPAPLTGPGSRNFVPNNTNGNRGVAFVDPAQYFDVTLDRGGETRLRNAAITIDRLTLANPGAGLVVGGAGALTVNLETEIQYGRLTVDSSFRARTLVNNFGVIDGGGTITAPLGVVNLGGVVAPGGHGVGTLTINGNFTQSPAGTVFYNIGRSSSDLIAVNGAANIAGNLFVGADRRLRFGERFVVVQANSVAGNFDRTFGSGTLLFGRTEADANSVDLVIDAHSLFSILGAGSQWSSLAQAIDFGRGAHFAELTGLFDLIDNVQIESLDFALPTIAPMNSFQTVPLAVQYTQDFTRGLDARTAELRAGVRGLSERSVLTGMRIAQAGDGADGSGASGLSRGSGGQVDTGDRLGFFISGQGNLSAVGDEGFEGDRYNPASLTSMSSADMTVGADYRVNDHFAIGVATTLSRYLVRDHEQGVTPLDHTGYGAAVYASLWDGGWHVDSYVGVARHDYDVARAPGLQAQYGQDVLGAPGAVQTMAGVRAGWTFEPVEGLLVGPSVAVSYSRLGFDGYRETGPSDFALDVESRSLQSTTVETALEFSYQPISGGRASPFAAYGRVALATEVGDGADIVSAHFVAAPDVAFDLARGLDRQWISTSAGMSYQLNDDLSAHLEVISDVGRGELSNTSAQAGLSWRF